MRVLLDEQLPRQLARNFGQLAAMPHRRVAMETYIDWMRSCYFISLVGNPAISVPCGFTAEGLPVGLQIVARHRDGWRLLQIAHAFEQASGVSRRWPGPL